MTRYNMNLAVSNTLLSCTHILYLEISVILVIAVIYILVCLFELKKKR
jgi:hypothetical protein